MEILGIMAIAMADMEPMSHQTDEICDEKVVRGRDAAARLFQLKVQDKRVQQRARRA